ncbi:MAG: anti-sigma regulatory factor [Myxococcales bacterium]|nr:anti-sigma regulatory factor [Myxococcales bacterium]
MRVGSEQELLLATFEARRLLLEMGASATAARKFQTAVSELLRNVLKYAEKGRIEFMPLARGSQVGLKVICSDKGPGIPDVALAMADSYSSSGTLGLGLPGVKRMVDSFELSSEVGKGTVVTIESWLP